MVAKAALAQTFDIQYPVAPQEASLNSNQPVLGFDSWGLSLTDPNDVALVLIQVKATDEKKWPPQEANRLVEECRMIVQDKSKLCRALCVLLRLLSDSNTGTAEVSVYANDKGKTQRVPFVRRSETSHALATDKK